MALIKEKKKQEAAYSKADDKGRVTIYDTPNKKVIERAFSQINPAKDSLDVALMNKYPSMDLDKLKADAGSVTNQELFQFTREEAAKNQQLTKAEQEATLGKKGYENWQQNSKLIQNMYDTDVTGTTEDKTKDRKRMYGVQSSLFKFSTPRVDGVPKPYRQSNELSHIKLKSGGKACRKNTRSLIQKKTKI